MSPGEDFVVDVRRNVISQARGEIVNRLTGSAFYQSTAILFPSTYALRIFREHLQKRLPTIGGVRLYTPASLRLELLCVRHPDWRLLPAENLIPWQVESEFSPGAVYEIQRLRPHERDRLCPHPLWARAESEKLFTPAALDVQLYSEAHHAVWDQFFSVGFSECSWENYHLLRTAAKCAKTTKHFFELTVESRSVARWRELWNYQPDGEAAGKISGNLEVCTVGNVTDFAFVILGKIASILGKYAPRQDAELPKIAIGFAGRSAHYHALRQRLEIARIPFLDILAKGRATDLSPLWQRWLEYQRRQKREECLALLDCKFALGLMEEFQWKDLRQCVLEYSRQNVTDDCGEMLPEEIKEWLRPLPACGKVEEFWQGTVEVFPQLRCLVSGAQVLGSLYDTVTRGEFLGWLEAAVENQFRETPQKNWAANVHIVGYDDFPFEDFDYVICGDWDGNKPKNCAEILGGMSLEGINESLEDFYYDFSAHVISVEAIIQSALEHSEEITVVTLQEIGTDMPMISNVENQLDMDEMFERGRRLRRLGIFFDGAEDKIESAGPDSPGDDVGRCVDAYQRRRNIKEPFGIYDFGAGGDEKWREKLLRSIPCKAWELVFERPEEVWMRQILRIEKLEKSIFDEIAMVTGTEVHAQLAQKFAQIAPPQNAIKYSSLADCGDINYIANGVHYQAFGITHALEKQTQMELAEFVPDSIKMEQNISSFITIGPAKIWARGRADLVANEGANYCVIDFKTRPAGRVFTMAQICQGKFLQIILYGLYYQCAGRTVGMRVLSPFQRPRSFEFSKLKPKDLEKINVFFSNFEKLQRSLNLGYGTSERFLAHAHSPLPEHIVNARRRLSGLAEVPGDDS
jgi:hypothetical protein